MKNLLQEIEPIIQKILSSEPLSSEDEEKLEEILRMFNKDRSNLIPMAKTAYSDIQSIKIAKNMLIPFLLDASNESSEEATEEFSEIAPEPKLSL